MRRATAVASAALLFGLAGCRPTPTVASRGGKSGKFIYRCGLFTATFPGQPDENKMRTTAGTETTLQTTASYVAGRGVLYKVTATTLPVRSSAFSVSKRLEQARNELKRDLRASTVQQRSTTYHGAPGREYKAVGLVATEWRRLFVVAAGPHPVVYEASVNDDEGKATDADANAFFTSLTFPTK